MTQLIEPDVDLLKAQPIPYWDNQSCLEYCRKHARMTVEEFGERLLAECEKIEKERALMNENHTV